MVRSAQRLSAADLQTEREGQGTGNVSRGVMVSWPEVAKLAPRLVRRLLSMLVSNNHGQAQRLIRLDLGEL